jgi:hypothetical protein
MSQKVQTIISTDPLKFTCMSEVLGNSVVTSYQVDQTFLSTIILESRAPDHGGGGAIDQRGAVGPNPLIF